MKLNPAKKIFIVMLAYFVCASHCYAKGLDALIEVGRGQAEIQKSYAEETAIYNAVKKAVGAGIIKKGQTSAEIGSKYGQPVVVVKEYSAGRDKWVYKPAKSSFFEGEKICLFFDKNGILDEIKKSE